LAEKTPAKIKRLGAALALAYGVVHLADIPTAWGIVWNATATFVAVIIISLLLERAGFFEWVALHVARWGGGRGKIPFSLIVLLGGAVASGLLTTVFAVLIFLVAYYMLWKSADAFLGTTASA
jgi:arsenical pump membrane protein